MKTDRPTRDQVKVEPAGYRLNAWVAEFVMGWPWIDPDEPYRWHHEKGGVIVRGGAIRMFPAGGGIPRQWSGCWDIADAWTVAEKVGGMVIEDWRRDPQKAGPCWSALVTLPNGHDTGQIVAETAPLAICRAALLAAITPGYGA